MQRAQTRHLYLKMLKKFCLALVLILSSLVMMFIIKQKNRGLNQLSQFVYNFVFVQQHLKAKSYFSQLAFTLDCEFCQEHFPAMDGNFGRALEFVENYSGLIPESFRRLYGQFRESFCSSYFHYALHPFGNCELTPFLHKDINFFLSIQNRIWNDIVSH